MLSRLVQSCRRFSPWISLPALVRLGGVTTDMPAAADMDRIDGRVWARERVLLPAGALIRVRLEDVAKMDVAAELIAETTIEPKGGPPWSFTLAYAREKIHSRGRYALRARIEADGRLLFINATHIPAFDRGTTTPVDILVTQVSRSPSAGSD